MQNLSLCAYLRNMAMTDTYELGTRRLGRQGRWRFGEGGKSKNSIGCRGDLFSLFRGSPAQAGGMYQLKAWQSRLI
jgi:hypothetical protein